MTALNNEQLGHPLLLKCNVTTVRGITSIVDIVSSTNDEVVRRVGSIPVDNLVVYKNVLKFHIICPKSLVLKLAM